MFAFEPEELGPVGVAGFVEEVGVDEARGVVVGRREDRPQKRLVVGEPVHHSSPVASGKLNIRLKFCTATPLAPRIRLSSAARTTIFPPRTTFTARSRKFVPVVSPSCREAGPHTHERLAGVVRAVEFDQLRLNDRARRRGVDRAEDAAVHRDEVRGEDYRDRLAGDVGQRLLDLRRVAVRADRVGGEVLVALREVVRQLRRPPGPGRGIL